MSTQPIDYEALAKQAGAVQSVPAGRGGVDYEALAKQAGAVKSESGQHLSASTRAIIHQMAQEPMPGQATVQTSGVDEGEELTPEDVAKNKAWDALPASTQWKLKMVPGAYDKWAEQFFHGQNDPYGPTAALGKVLEPTVGQMAEGTGDILEGQFAKGGHKIIKAGTLMALPVMTKGALAAPVTALKAAAGGYVGSKVAGAGAEAFGATPDQQALTEDIGGIVGGGAGASLRGPKNLRDIAGKFGDVATKIAKTGKEIGEPVPVIGEAVDQLARLQKLRGLPARLRDIWLKKKAAAEVGTTQSTAAGPVPADSGPAPAPYRLSGSQITDATTVTPRRILGPDRQLPAAPPETAAPTPAVPPKTSQVLKDAGVTAAMKSAGVAAPSASVRPIRETTGSLGITGDLTPRSELTIPPGLTGEDAALMQLTKYHINELRSGAIKRKIPVSRTDTHAALIEKIQGSLKPEETAAFEAAAQASKLVPSKFPANNMMADNLNEAASGLQAAKGSPYEIASLRSAAAKIRDYPQSISEVDLAKTKIPGIDKRIGKRIKDFFDQQKAVPMDEEAPVPGVNNGLSLADALRASLRARGINPPD